MLRELLEVVYLAASMSEEARYPKFNLVAVPSNSENYNTSIQKKWLFQLPRLLTVDELRRLAPAVSYESCVILVEWDVRQWKIIGLADLGSKWHHAHLGLGYEYHVPSALIIKVDGPGRIRVYQGQFIIGMLMHGKISNFNGYGIDMSLHAIVRSGLTALNNSIKKPVLEEPSEWSGFEFIALMNVFVGSVNLISRKGQGGTIVIVLSSISDNVTGIKLKYKMQSDNLRQSFVNFMNFRHEFADIIAREENEEIIPVEEKVTVDSHLRDSESRLIEDIQFITDLSKIDGAVLLSSDLRILGFGGEIIVHGIDGCEVHCCNELPVNIKRGGKKDNVNIEQFGMRHRSAIKLVCQQKEYTAIVISKDGPISIIWSYEDLVYLSTFHQLRNANMPWGS